MGTVCFGTIKSFCAQKTVRETEFSQLLLVLVADKKFMSSSALKKISSRQSSYFEMLRDISSAAKGAELRECGVITRQLRHHIHFRFIRQLATRPEPFNEKQQAACVSLESIVIGAQSGSVGVTSDRRRPIFFICLIPQLSYLSLQAAAKKSARLRV
jgi:hypothetical protein